MGKKFCPVCGSEEISDSEDGMYSCMDCGHTGKNFPSKELIGEAEGLDEELDDDSEEMPTSKEKKLIKDVKKAKKFEPKSKVKVKITTKAKKRAKNK